MINYAKFNYISKENDQNLECLTIRKRNVIRDSLTLNSKFWGSFNIRDMTKLHLWDNNIIPPRSRRYFWKNYFFLILFFILKKH